MFESLKETFTLANVALGVSTSFMVTAGVAGGLWVNELRQAWMKSRQSKNDALAQKHFMESVPIMALDFEDTGRRPFGKPEYVFCVHKRGSRELNEILSEPKHKEWMLSVVNEAIDRAFKRAEETGQIVFVQDEFKNILAKHEYDSFVGIYNNQWRHKFSGFLSEGKPVTNSGLPAEQSYKNFDVLPVLVVRPNAAKICQLQIYYVSLQRLAIFPEKKEMLSRDGLNDYYGRDLPPVWARSSQNNRCSVISVLKERLQLDKPDLTDPIWRMVANEATDQIRDVAPASSLA